MIYNDEQWELIRQASPHFETARHDYIRNAPRWLTEQILKVYEDATGKTLMARDLSCAICVLRIYQTVGKTYFADLDERNKIETQKENDKTDSKDGKRKPERNDKAKNTRSPKTNKKGVSKKRN